MKRRPTTITAARVPAGTAVSPDPESCSRRCGRWLTLVWLALSLCGLTGCGDGASLGSTASGGDAAGSVEPLSVLAAASTRQAIERQAQAFTERTGVEVRIVAAGSNALANQILAGAPGELFLSAILEWGQAVQEEGLVLRSQRILSNELVLIVPAGNPAGVGAPDDLLSEGVRRIALAGERVPAGRYAQQALAHLGIHDTLLRSGRIARGQDVRQTLTFVQRAEAEAGIVYATDARIAPEVQIVHRFDPAGFEPIAYPLLLLKPGPGADEPRPEAVELFEFLASAEASDTWANFGFTPLAEPVTTDAGG